MSRATVLCSCLLVLVCSPSWADDANKASELIDHATAKYQTAEKLGFAWRNAKLSLDEAKRAYSSNDYAAAETAAQQSIKLSDASIAQAEREAEAWQSRPPFN